MSLVACAPNVGVQRHAGLCTGAWTRPQMQELNLQATAQAPERLATDRKSCPLRMAHWLPSFGSAPAMGSPSAKKPCKWNWEGISQHLKPKKCMQLIIIETPVHQEPHEREAVTPCSRAISVGTAWQLQQPVARSLCCPAAQGPALQAHLFAGGDEVVGVH